MAERVIHEPHCNTACAPNSHYLTDGVGMPHLHRTDLDAECGEHVRAHRGAPPDGGCPCCGNWPDECAGPPHRVLCDCPPDECHDAGADGCYFGAAGGGDRG